MSVQDNINQLMSNKRYVLIPPDIEGPADMPCFVIKDPTVEDRNFFLFVKRREEAVALQEGIATEQQLLETMRVAGNWTQQDDEILKKADDHIIFLSGELKNQKFIARKKNLQVQIDETEKKKHDVELKKYEIYVASAEYYAHEVAAYALTKRVIYNIDNELLWPTDISFGSFKGKYFSLLLFMIHQVMSDGVLEIKDIREIARSPEWRLIWTLQRENLLGLFNRPIGDFTINHKLLIYWSRLYDLAFESHESPTHDIINNDDQFDQWLANKNLEKIEKESMRSSEGDHQEHVHMLNGEYIETCVCGMKEKNIGKGLGEKLPHKSDCRFGVFRPFSKEEKQKIAEQIYSRNSTNVRTIINQQADKIDQVGFIDEKELRNKKTRLALGMKHNVIPVHKK